MVLDDHADPVGRTELGQLPQSVGRPLNLLVVGAAAGGVHADRMAAEILGPLDPAIVVLHGLLPLLFVGVTELAFAVAHDQQALDAGVVGPRLQFLQRRVVVLLVLVELIDVLDGVDAELLLRDLREIHRIGLLVEEGPVERPLGERYLVEGRLLLGEQAPGGSHGSGGSQSGCLKEATTIETGHSGILSGDR